MCKYNMFTYYNKILSNLSGIVKNQVNVLNLIEPVIGFGY